MSGGKKLGFGSRKPAAAPKPPENSRRYNAEDLDGFEEKAIAEARQAGTIRLVSKTLIDADPDQPRKHFNQDSILELAASLRDHGQIQPIIVKDKGDGRFQIIAGERRWRAFMADESLDLVEIVVRNDVQPLDVLLMQIHENEQRESMNPLDTARAYARVKAMTGSQKDVARLLNKSEATVSVYLSLLEAPPEVQALTETISDATTINLVGRLVHQSAEEGRAMIEAIRTGQVAEGSVRSVVKEKLKDTQKSKDKPKVEKAPRRVLQADKASWIIEGETKHLLIEAGGATFEIRLPGGVDWESLS